MSTPRLNTKSPTIKRILKEAQELSSSPSADYAATPLESDLFEWHFTLRGPPNSTFANGLYHGRIVLPPTYPLRPPSFRFVTPSGRFETNREICLSISGHHEETWQPAWGVRTALVALRTFMETDAKGQLGGLDTTDAFRKKLADESRGFKCATCGKTNETIIKEREEEAAKVEAEARAQGQDAENKEVEIPPELKLGWKDEMKKGSDAGAAGASTEATVLREAAATAEDSESAELAEGFVQTVPMEALRDPHPSGSSSATPLPRPMPAAQPAQGVPQPTRTVPASGTMTPVGIAHQAQIQRRSAQNAVPQWIDTTIMALGFALLAMILKVLLGL